MSDLHFLDVQPMATQNTPQAAATAAETCEECLGSGGWYRYEPALDPAGLLYLSCLHCRGQGRRLFAQA